MRGNETQRTAHGLYKYVTSLTPNIASHHCVFTRPPRTQNNEIGIIHVSSPFDFPQLEFTMSFVQLAGVIRQCVKVIFDPMNNGLGRTTIPFKYYMLALSSMVMFCLYLLWLLKTVVSRLAPDTGMYITSWNVVADIRCQCRLPS